MEGLEKNACSQYTEIITIIPISKSCGEFNSFSFQSKKKKKDTEFIKVHSNYFLFLVRRLKMWTTKLIPLSWKSNFKFPVLASRELKS